MEVHAELEKELTAAEKRNADDLTITELKKKKLFAKDLIIELKSLGEKAK
jgi:hypothetical protein